MEATFQEVIASGAAQAGCADAYDAWAQREQARVLIEYADWQKQNAASRARIVMPPQGDCRKSKFVAAEMQ